MLITYVCAFVCKSGWVVGCMCRVGWGVYLSIMSTILMPMATDDLLNMVCSDGATCAHEQGGRGKNGRKGAREQGRRSGRGYLRTRIGREWEEWEKGSQGTRKRE